MLILELQLNQTQMHGQLRWTLGCLHDICWLLLLAYPTIASGLSACSEGSFLLTQQMPGLAHPWKQCLPLPLQRSIVVPSGNMLSQTLHNILGRGTILEENLPLAQSRRMSSEKSLMPWAFATTSFGVADPNIPVTYYPDQNIMLGEAIQIIT